MGSLSSAHEGHDKVPNAQIAKMSPPGIVKTTSELFIEVQEINGKIRILIYDHDKKDIPPNELALTGVVKYPRKHPVQKVGFSTVDSFFETKIDSKGSHRYTLELEVIFRGKKIPLSFNIEPTH